MIEQEKLAGCLREKEDGVTLAVFVQPRSSRNEVVGVHDQHLKVRIRAAPVEGKANRELARFLARTVGVSPSRVRVSSGLSGRRKQVNISGLSAADLIAGLKAGGL
ncbi:MAG: YggU family protein [Kiritimatiellaeota bacterium]|nr:YggU family protein [Kiritimatiellota bacterium]